MATTNDRTTVNLETGKRYYLCSWAGGSCNVPVSTVRSVLCRWHGECARFGADHRDFAAFDRWLTKMQYAYPSVGIWSWKVERLWPMVNGKKESIWKSH